MRICILAHGKSVFSTRYAQTFAARGHDAQVFSMTPCEVPPGTPIRVVAAQDFKPWESRARLWPYLKTLGPVRRAIRQWRPDVVFAVYLSSAGVLACLSGHPCVVVSAQGSDVNLRVGSAVWRAVYRWLGRRACLVHAVSEPLAEKLEHRVGIPRDRIVVAPVGVNTDLLAMADPAVRPHAGEILCTRAHYPVYDQATLVRAMARLKARGISCRVRLIDTEYADRTRDLIRAEGVEDLAVFRPPYRESDLPGLMAEADVYVSTSKSDGTSISLLEAMSTGTFPVVSDIEANRPWIEHGRNGFLFPVGDDAALADRLQEALARPDLRAAAASVNRRIVVERGDILRGAQKLIAAFERCLER